MNIFTRPILGLVGVIAIGWASPTLAQSGCAQFELIGNGARTNYQPFESSPTIDTFDIKVRRFDSHASTGISSVRFLLVDQTPKPSGPGLGSLGPLLYDVAWLQDSTRTVLVSGVEQPVSMTGAQIDFPGNNGVVNSRFQFIIPAGQEAVSGEHRQTLTVRYQCLDSMGSPVGAVYEQATGIDMVASVPPYAAAYIGSVGTTRGTISFGVINAPNANLSKALGITALSTLPYEVEIDSEFGGQLKRTRTASNGIIYAMSYGGISVADGDRIICPMTRAPMGTVVPFQVTLDLPSVASQPMGEYSDTVTLTFTPRDVIVGTGCRVAN